MLPKIMRFREEILIIFYIIQIAHSIEHIMYNQVETEQGAIRGQVFETDEGIRAEAYKGIPFAEPPVGDLRWRVRFQATTKKLVPKHNFLQLIMFDKSLNFIRIVFQVYTYTELGSFLLRKIQALMLVLEFRLHQDKHVPQRFTKFNLMYILM